MSERFDIVIVGAGAAGVGMGVCVRALQADGLNALSFAIFERERIGASFLKWPKEMRFITPSFTSNAFGLPDLNAIAPETSPAYTLDAEHPSGPEYASYLRDVAQVFELPVREGVSVAGVERTEGGFALRTSAGDVRARFLIWAAGEFGSPKDRPFPGAHFAIHNSAIRSWSQLSGKEYIVIGGYESGVDAAINLAQLGKRARVLASSATWAKTDSDPSLVLSPHTKQRLREAMKTQLVTLEGGVRVTQIEKDGRKFVVRAQTGDGDEMWAVTPNPPILATGFTSGATQIKSLFEWRDDGMPLVSELDESTLAPNLFLVGPSLRHKKHIFCFIYKFRQRFAVVAHEMAERAGWNPAPLQAYREQNFFLDDLTCCDVECAC